MHSRTLLQIVARARTALSSLGAALFVLPMWLQAADRGGGNTSDGAFALYDLTSGIYNTGIGYDSLRFETSGNYNTATGAFTLHENRTGGLNTANGNQALYSNTTGNGNTANGNQALYSSTTGSVNTATGHQSLLSNTTGAYNSAIGSSALVYNTTGFYNFAGGSQALYNNTTGQNNTAVGYQAGYDLTTGSNNIVIGSGVPGNAGESNTIRIGKPGIQTKTVVAGIYGNTVASGVGVIIGAKGQLGTVQSSQRYKRNIEPMNTASEALLELQPVTYEYNEDLDPDGIPQFGLIAEQVAKVNSDLVARDEEGKITTVRYDAVNAMLLNEFLKEHRKVEALEAANTQQQKENAAQQKQIEALAAGLQKVSTKIDVSEKKRRVAHK